MSSIIRLLDTVISAFWWLLLPVTVTVVAIILFRRERTSARDRS